MRTLHRLMIGVAFVAICPLWPLSAESRPNPYARPGTYGSPDPYDCRLKIRTTLGIAPNTGYLYPGFRDMVKTCVLKAERAQDAKVAKPRSKTPKSDIAAPKAPASEPSQPNTAAPGSAAPADVATTKPSAPEPVPSIPSPDVTDLRHVTGKLSDQIALLQTLVTELQADKSHNANPQVLINVTVELVLKKLDELKRRQSQHPEYQTPVRPDNGQSYPTARKISESYPSIPYYIAGTS